MIVHPAIGKVRGRDATLSIMKPILGAADGYQRTIDDLVVEGDDAVFRFTISGTHTGR